MEIPGATRACSLCEVAGGFLRLAAYALAPVVVVGLAAEVALRVAGQQPQELARVGFVATIPDGYTDWAMRPGVRLNEYSLTNGIGLHEDREVTLARPVGMKRVAVVGSSVVWAIGEGLENTIPRSMERELVAAGCKVQVLNFGAHGYNIVNASAYVQTKVQQFRPDAVVLVMDTQMSYPQFPSVNPRADPRPVRQLGWAEGMLKRASEYSAVLTWLDDTPRARGQLASMVRLPLASNMPPKAPLVVEAWQPLRLAARFVEHWSRDLADRISLLRMRNPTPPLVMRSAVRSEPEALRTVQSYEAKRARDLAALVASLSAFSKESGIDLYFTTPYAPYFHATPAEMSKFSLSAATQVADLYGSAEAAVRRDVELASKVIAGTARAHGAGVIDFLPLTRSATTAEGYFSTDGIHYTQQGYRHVGSLIAARLLQDGFCGAGARPAR